MKILKPTVFLIGEQRIIPSGLEAYLAHVGASEWDTDSPTDGELLAEFYGRLCYRSWKPGMNPNVTRVREGNREYLEHVLDVGHGSLLEHSYLNWVFADVSRVFTHELVRHRVGLAISQESLRFVRLTELGFWLPAVIDDDPTAVEIFTTTVECLEQVQRQLAEHFELDKKGIAFAVKKEITSAMRRLAPIGLATTIGWTCNIRTLRWVIEARTDPSAEEEIRMVFGQVANEVIARYPNLFQDFEATLVNGHNWYKPKNRKV